MKFFLFFLANEIKKEKLISKHASVLKIKGSNGRNKRRNKEIESIEDLSNIFFLFFRPYLF